MLDVTKTLAPAAYVDVHSGPPVLYGVRVLPAPADASATPYRNLWVRYRKPTGEEVERYIPDDSVYTFATNHIEAKGDAGSYLFQVLDANGDGISVGTTRPAAGGAIFSELHAITPNADSVTPVPGAQVFADGDGVELGPKCAGVRVSIALAKPDGTPLVAGEAGYIGAGGGVVLPEGAGMLHAYRRENFGTDAAPVLRWLRCPELDLSLRDSASYTGHKALTWADLPVPVRTGRVCWRPNAITVSTLSGPATKLRVQMRTTNDA